MYHCGPYANPVRLGTGSRRICSMFHRKRAVAPLHTVAYFAVEPKTTPNVGASTPAENENQASARLATAHRFIVPGLRERGSRLDPYW